MLKAAFVLSMFAAQPVMAQAAGDRAADRQAIVAGAEAWGNSFVTGDASVADRLLADDFSGTSSRGQRYDKATLLGWVQAGPNLSANKTIVTDVRFYGDVAVVHGRDDVVAAAPARDAHVSIWTDVWVKREGRWWIVSAQDVRVAP